MFYLNEIINFCKKNILLSFVLFLSSFTLLNAVSNYSHYEEEIVKLIPKLENEFYFNALLSKEIHVEQVRSKISDLPGVVDFELSPQANMKNIVSNLGTEFGLNNEEVETMSSLRSFKISLQENLSQKSINLIREYLERIAGTENILLGAVTKKVNDDLIIKSFLRSIKQWPMQVIIALVFFVWIISFISFNSKLINHSYIIEKFTRKNSVRLKMALSLFSIVIVFNLASFILMEQSSYMSLALASTSLLLIPFVFCYKLTWRK